MTTPALSERGDTEIDAERKAGSATASKEATIINTTPTPIDIRDSSPPKNAGRRHILVLKLDHFGDFIIGRPALEALRRAFPSDHIRLICGRWNLGAAQASGLADEVRAYDFFPEHALGWNGQPTQDLSIFDAAAEGEFDIAIDLRVDGDTRELLKRVDAKLRCGIGARTRFEFLDVILPVASRSQDGLKVDLRTNVAFTPDRFSSRMQRKGDFMHETSGRFAHGHLIFGPYIQLPCAHYRIRFGLRAQGLFGWPTGKLRIEVARGNSVVAKTPVRLQDIRGDGARPPTLMFENDDDVTDFEFRVHMSGLSLGGMLQFTGVRLDQVGTMPAARYRPAELHIGEQLSLLVELLKQRALPAPRSALPQRTEAEPSSAASLVNQTAGGNIMIAPFSNSSLRDWPIDNYSTLVRLLLQETDSKIILLGSKAQESQLAQLVAEHSNISRLLNLGGRTAWRDMPEILGMADLVICNNSGIAHLAGDLGRPTLAIYSGSHQPQEWGPRGEHVRTLMAEVACSPCGFDRIEFCPHEHLCMRLITPEIVLAQVKSMLAAKSGTAPVR